MTGRRLLMLPGILFLLAPGAPANAAVFGGLDTTKASLVRGSFLARGAGARATGMGEAFTAVADDASAQIWNPGGLGQIGALAVLGQFDAAGLGTTISYLAVAVPVGSLVAGASLETITYGDLTYRDTTGAETGKAFLMDGAFTQSWAMKNPSWLGGLGWTGVGIEVVQEAYADALLGINLGSLVPLTPNFTAGWAWLHAGRLTEESGLPETLRLGSAYSGARGRVAADLEYETVGGIMSASLGGELRLLPMLALRAGYKMHGQEQVSGGLRGVTAGLGLKLDRWSVDYAYQPFGDLAVSHRIAVEYRMPTPVHVVEEPVPPVVRAKAAARARAAASGGMPALTGEAESVPVAPRAPVSKAVRPVVAPVPTPPVAPVTPPVMPAAPPSATATGQSSQGAHVPSLMPVVPVDEPQAADEEPKPRDTTLPAPPELESTSTSEDATTAPIIPVHKGKGRKPARTGDEPAPRGERP